MTVDNNFMFLDADKIKPSNKITFICGDKEMLRLEADGNIFVKGVIAENNKDVVEGMIDFIRGRRMEYMLSERDVKVIKSSLKAHIRQCEEFVDKGLLGQVETMITKDKIILMKELLENM